MRRTAIATALTVTVALALAACGGDDDDATDVSSATGATTAPAATGVEGTATDGSAAPGTVAGTPETFPTDDDAAACADGKTLDDGALTIATGEPAFPPYVIDDAPETGQGFEAALAYAVASTMGVAPDAVTWTRTTFEGAIQPGPKDFDFNLQQYSITPDREAAVSFSQPYYAGNQAILGYADSPAATAETIGDFQALKIGVAAGTTSLDFVTDVIQPTSDPFVFNDNAAAKQALDTKQIDAVVADLPTALYITGVEIEGSEVYGQFPPSDGNQGESWGLLFSKGNPLVECADLALTALDESGALEAITTTWMSDNVDVPEITLE
jgi:polar amino acid transport system substrate-binding protein